MTKSEIKRARQCFEVEMPDMVKDITKGKVRFTPSVIVSKKPLRLWEAARLDSAEYYPQEMLNEFYSVSKPGQYDAVGYYFLHYDASSGYKIPRAGYGVGGYNSEVGLGMFAINCTPKINLRDEIFLHEWMHGLDGFYGNKPGVKLPKGMLHGAGDHGYKEKRYRPIDTFNGWMEWYRDYLNGMISEGSQKVGLGSAAWKHGPMRQEAAKRTYNSRPLAISTYPAWIYKLMKGDLSDAVLGEGLFKEKLKRGELSKTPWTLKTWNANAGTRASITSKYGGAFMLNNRKPNDAKIVRSINLKPLSNYLFSAEVRIRRVKITDKEGQYAVNLYAGDSVSTKELTGTKSWTQVVLPFTTGPEPRSYELKMGIGGSSSLAKGSAYFRNVQLRQIAYPAKSVLQR